MVATEGPILDRAIDCWGGRMTRRTQPIDSAHPEVPVERIGSLACPLLGIFGEEDQNPTPAQVAQLEQELKKHGKSHEFHNYPGAGHGFFYHERPMYRQEQAVDGWKQVFAFLETHLAAAAR